LQVVGCDAPAFANVFLYITAGEQEPAHDTQVAPHRRSPEAAFPQVEQIKPSNTRLDSPRLVALIQCGKRKQTSAAPAGELYTGALFRKSMAYARKRGATALFILSAKHGVLGADVMIEPYEVTLNRMPKLDRVAWCERVLRQLHEQFNLDTDHFLLLASARYREGLVEHMKHVEVPMAGLSQGRQLQFLKEAIE
jgi:hypothetical protein